MLVKGTIKNNLLTTSLGQFFVSRKGDQEVTGIFEIKKIKPAHIEKSVNVDGFSSVAKIPVMEAEISAVYLKKYDCLDKASPAPTESSTLVDKKDDSDQANVDEIDLLGKPYNQLENTYKVDAALDREKQRQIIDFLKSKGAELDVGTQVWSLKHNGRSS